MHAQEKTQDGKVTLPSRKELLNRIIGYIEILEGDENKRRRADVLFILKKIVEPLDNSTNKETK